MPKKSHTNEVPQGKEERRGVKKDEENIKDMNKDIPKGPHQPIGDVERWKK